MDDQLYRQYYQLRPPGSVLREANRVARIVLVLNAGLLIVRFHTPLLKNPDNIYIPHMCDVIGVANAFLCLGWFVGIALVGWYRISKYRRALGTLSPKAFTATYPLLAMLVLATAVVIAWIAHAKNGVDLCVAIVSALAMVLTVDAGIARKYAGRFLPHSVPRLFMPGMDLMLGPSLGTNDDNYISTVLHFADGLVADGHNAQIQHHCEAMYSNPEVFEVFQRTLSSPEETAPFVSAMIARRIDLKQHWTLMDIGCGDGSFTQHFLSGLPTLPAKIIGLDPSQELLERFRETISAEFARVHISLRQGRVEEDASTLDRSDLLLASHSLYSILDRSREEAKEVVRKLLRRTRMAAFVLASRNSNAYAVKGAVYERLKLTDKLSFGSDLVEIVEDLHPEIFVRDSFMDVTELFRDDQLLLGWYSYFCRMEVRTLEPEIGFLRNVMQHCSMPLENLPEARVSEVRKLGGMMAARASMAETRVLMHKEVVVILAGHASEKDVSAHK